jgi:hypothetical protein
LDSIYTSKSIGPSDERVVGVPQSDAPRVAAVAGGGMKDSAANSTTRAVCVLAGNGKVAPTTEGGNRRLGLLSMAYSVARERGWWEARATGIW